MSLPRVLGLLDTNVVVRSLFPTDPHCPRCLAILAALEQGEAEAWIDVTVVHELTYVLGRLPTFSRADVHTYVRGVLLAEGVHADEKAALIEALDRWAIGSTGFVDAWLAVLARRHGLPVCSINAGDFPDVPNTFTTPREEGA
jgi:predicted nucleic-acid-binding protein